MHKEYKMADKKQVASANNDIHTLALPENLLKNIVHQIESAKSLVAGYTNSALVMLYWHIGFLINEEILNNKRAEYGEQIRGQVTKRNIKYAKAIKLI